MMSNIRQFTGPTHRDPQGGGGGGGGSDMNDLTPRVESLERDMNDIKVTLARMEAKLDTFATGESLHKEIGGLRSESGGLRSEMHSLLRQQTAWSVGTIIASAGLVFAIMRYLPT